MMRKIPYHLTSLILLVTMTGCNLQRTDSDLGSLVAQANQKNKLDLPEFKCTRSLEYRCGYCLASINAETFEKIKLSLKLSNENSISVENASASLESPELKDHMKQTCIGNVKIGPDLQIFQINTKLGTFTDANVFLSDIIYSMTSKELCLEACYPYG